MWRRGLKIAVFTPIPSASVKIATTRLKTGFLMMSRRPYLMSESSVSIDDPHRTIQ